MDLNKKIISYETMETSLEYVKEYIDEKSGKGSTKISEMEDFDNTVVATGTGDYIAMTKNTDGKWQEEDIKTEEYTEEELKALLGLTETELDYLSGVINDNVVETGKTWSSSKIFSDIVNVKQDKLTAGNNIRIEADGTISSIGNPINLYDKDTYYEGGDVCHYNNYVYICNNPTTGDFDPSRWVRLGDYLTALTEDDIKDMLALTTEQLDTLASIILDGEIRVDKTHSSSKIYADIQEAIQTAKDYTLKEIGKAVGASYSIVTTVDDMVDNKVIYLLLNGSVYDMYIVEEDGSAIKVGDLNVDLSNYYTKSEIDNNFLKKSEAEGTYAKSETVTNHIDDTAIHMTQDEKDKILNKDDVVTVLNEDVTNEQIGSAKVVYEELNKKIDKASITTTVDANSTDKQIPSAKSVYDSVTKNNNIKTYYLLSQLGITTTTCTIKDIWDKMPVNSIAIIDTNASIVTDLDVITTALNVTIDTVYGFLTIGKFEERTILEFRRSYTDSAIEPETFIGYCIGKNCTFIQWKKMILSSIDEANKVTTITFSDTTNYEQHSGIELKYYTLNGVCYVSGGVDCVTPSSALKYLAKLSKPKLGYSYAKGIMVNDSASDTSLLNIYIDGSGNLGLQHGLAGGSYRFTFSYPVAE